MAGVKETPRQKMIGMMYLVLTAMLALNVSKDILNAFAVVDKGLLETQEILSQKNLLAMTKFKAQYEQNKDKVQKYYDEAVKVETLSDELVENILDLRREVIGYIELNDRKAQEIEYKDPESGEMIKTDLRKVEVEFLKNKDDYTKTTEILVEAAGPKLGVKLKENILKYKEEILSIINSPKDKKLDPATMGLKVEGKYWSEHEGVNISWEKHRFYNSVEAATVCILDQLVAEVKNVQADATNILYANIDEETFKFDVIEPKVLATSTYVVQGDKYQADIFVAAYSETENPVVYIKPGVDTMLRSEMTNFEKQVGTKGKFVYEAPAGSVGDQKYAGYIGLKKPTAKSDRPEDYDYKHFKGYYNVGKPSAVVNAVKMNAFYIGVTNPVAVSVSGYPANRINVTMSNGQIAKVGGMYGVRVTKVGKSEIRVSVKNDDGSSTSMGTFPFRNKPIPPPVCKIGNLRGGQVNPIMLSGASGIKAVYEGALFPFKARVVSFDLSYQTPAGVKRIQNRGGNFNAQIKAKLKSVRRGQIITFQNIKVLKQDKTTVSSSMSFTIR